MKKLLLLILALVIALFVFASCDLIGKHEHDFVLTKTDEPTCTAKGVNTYACECGETKTEEYGEATGHTFELVSTVEPVCDKAGTKSYKCSCGETKTEEYGESAGHTFELVSTVEPTCKALGTKNYECSCGETKTEQFGELTDHDYELTNTKKAGCEKDGLNEYTCKICAETKSETLAATGHDYEQKVLNEPTCGRSGAYKYTCTKCKHSYTQKVGATGQHTYDEDTEASRILKCTGPSCASVKIREYDGKYKDVIVYKLTDDDLEVFDTVLAELAAIIDAADLYDATLHAYEEGSDTEAAYLVMEAKYEELYEILEYIIEQYQIAQIEYYMDMSNTEKSDIFNYVSELRTELVAEFYSFSQPLYDSMYREYYYYGMSEEEINAFIFDSNAVSNPEYKALVDRNTAIELEFDAITNPASDPRVLSLYAEFVSNNKRIAEILGYDNYLEYAYENVYDRDYSYTDVQAVADYVKEYIVPIYLSIYGNWNYITGENGSLTQTDVDIYYSQVSDSFFDYYDSNVHLNDYIDLLAFTSNPNKQLSFSDELNNLVMDGNLFRGDYEGAFVTYLYKTKTPVAYFGPSYSSPFTVAHEFGHYMNEKYNDNKYNQSYDLLEMHSQGNEVLYLRYLEGKLTRQGNALVETYNLLVMLDTIVTALAVDTFEQAIYTDYYNGSSAAIIMADGTITADEYDLLFKSIIADFGATGYVNEGYWRYVTIHAPCYYVSYSISAISVLQLYPMSAENYEGAIDAYLKLFTYTDALESEDDYMSTEEVLEYAGLYSYNDEELYQMLYDYFIPAEDEAAA